jgi:hypothetical protein
MIEQFQIGDLVGRKRHVPPCIGIIYKVLPIGLADVYWLRYNKYMEQPYHRISTGLLYHYSEEGTDVSSW